MIKNENKLTWTSDLRVAYEVATGTPATETPWYFNDKHVTCRRIKFSLSSKHVNDETLAKIQTAIQARRPNHTVQVAGWGSNYGSQIMGNVVVYYRMRNSRVMDHTVK